MTDPECSATLVKRAGTSDKELKLYEGAWHALLSEQAWADQIYPDIQTWVEARL